MSEKSELQILNELKTSLTGLRLEVEGWRVHNSGNADFFLAEIDHLISRVDAIKTVKA